MTFMRQCTFVSCRGDSESRTTGWIPDRGARVGALVTIEGSEGLVWKIETVSDIRLPEDYVRRKERDYRSHRKASDI